MTDLLSCLLISPAVTCVENFVAVIHDVFVATGDHHRVGTLTSTTRNPCSSWTMYARLRECDTGGEAASWRIACHVTKEAFYHYTDFSCFCSVVSVVMTEKTGGVTMAGSFEDKFAIQELV